MIDEDEGRRELPTRLHRRILGHLTPCGRLPKAEPDDDEVQPDVPLLAELYAASVQGRVAIGDMSGANVERLGRRCDARPLFLPGGLCCDMDGYSPRQPGDKRRGAQASLASIPP